MSAPEYTTTSSKSPQLHIERGMETKASRRRWEDAQHLHQTLRQAFELRDRLRAPAAPNLSSSHLQEKLPSQRSNAAGLSQVVNSDYRITSSS